MDAKELRSFNWVLGPSGTPIQIRGAGIGGVESGLLKVSPIPLTPEILEACGFKKNFGTDWYRRNKMAIMFLDPEPDVPLNTAFEYFNTSFPWTPIYLHQLQNLIHALTGEELTVNLPVTS